MQSTVWYEKYKPSTLDDVILPDSLKSKIKTFIETKTLPNLGFWSNEPGLGKSSTANAIVSDLQKLGHEAIWVNASLEKGIDLLRGRIQTFATAASFDGQHKIVVLDECLEENERVILLDGDTQVYTKLRDLEKGKIYDCLSVNLETHELERDTCEIVSDKVDTIYEVTLEDERNVLVTSNHPFIVNQGGKYESKSIDDGLGAEDFVVCLDNSVRVKSIVQKDVKSVINLCVHKNHTFITKNGIVTHNCDHLTPDAQAAFRGFIDDYSANCRFIFTGNFQNKIIEPLLDRLWNIDFATFDRKDIAMPMALRLSEILKKEQVEFSKDDIIKIMSKYYPRMRAMIAYLQKASTTGVLVVGDDLDSADMFADILGSLSGDYQSLIAKVNSLSSPDNMYSFIYSNVSKYFSSNPAKAIMIAAKYQHMAGSVRDKHLNLMACLTELKS